MHPVIGIDFDNTIVSYEDIFHRIAMEKGLISAEVPRTKEGVRNYLRAVGKEDSWTELQGYVYGARMKDVSPFPGAIEFFTSAIKKGIDVYIVSHKTRHPYMGPAYDLHEAAYGWLEFQGFFESIGLPRDRVYFEETKEGKLKRIADINCSHFIDDLPEFLMENGFPKDTERLLFAPNSESDLIQGEIKRFNSWGEIGIYFGIV